MKPISGAAVLILLMCMLLALSSGLVACDVHKYLTLWCLLLWDRRQPAFEEVGQSTKMSEWVVNSFDFVPVISCGF